MVDEGGGKNRMTSRMVMWWEIKRKKKMLAEGKVPKRLGKRREKKGRL